MSEETRRPVEAEGTVEEESFAAMFEASESASQQDLRAGAKVRGTIIDITKDNVFVDTGSKVDGVASRDEFLDKEGNLSCAVGDTVELYVVNANNNEIVLSKAVSGAGGIEALQQAYENTLPVQGRVKSTCKGGYNVQIMGRRAFCPVSQIDAVYVEDPEAYVDKEFKFRIVTFEQNGRNIVVSRRKLLDEERQEAVERFQEEVAPGAVLEGTVTRIKPFGAFVELMPGLEGMVHVSELGWSRVGQPEDLVSVGETIKVKVISVETDKKKGGLRIALSSKQASQDPWETVGEKLSKGDMVEGTVVRLAPFGAFVELLPGIEGLVHISELSYVQRVNKPEDVVSVGETITVKIKDIDLDARRIGLSLRDAQGDPWAEVDKNFAPGSNVTGVVEKRETFGLFVNVAPGVTGLMPKSLMSRAKDAKALESSRPGDEIQAVVQALDVNARKMTLAPEGLQEAEDENQDWRKEAAQYVQQPRTEASDSGGMNILGDKFKEAMARKGK